MVSLAEQFLNDIDEEEVGDEEVEENGRELREKKDEEGRSATKHGALSSVNENEVHVGSKRRRSADGMELEAIEKGRGAQDLADGIFAAVDAEKGRGEGAKGGETDDLKPTGLFGSGKLEDVLQAIVHFDAARDDGYELVMRSVRMAGEIDEEVFRLFRALRAGYAPKFPEMETLIFNPLDYARVVAKVGNEVDLTKVDLAAVLPSATVITVTVTASATNGAPLDEDSLQSVLTTSDQILQLDNRRTKLFKFVESQTSSMAPNLSAVVGSATAAQLIGLAGGVMELASIPSCNLQVLGAKKTSRAFSVKMSSTSPNENTPPDLRMRASRVVCAKCTLAARVDASKSDPSGKIGRDLHDFITKKIEKWMEPPPAKTAKPLPVPDEKPRRKRGGKRYRQQKELYAMTEMRKQQNRVAFGKAEESYGNSMEKGLGMIGADGSGKVRVQAKKTDSVAKAANRKLSKIQNRGGSGAKAAGLTTTLTFTDQQGGFELGAMTPMPGRAASGAFDAKDGTKSNYFSSATPFMGSSSKRS